MLRLKLRMLSWSRDIASAIWRRRHPGRQMELRFPLPLPDGAPAPAWLLAYSLLGEVEPDDPDEPTEKEVARRMRMARRQQQQYTTGAHAPEAVFPSRPWREPEPLDRIVAEGKAAARRLGRTLQVPAEVREAEYRAQQAWIGLERGKYAAKKGKGKSRAKGAAA